MDNIQLQPEYKQVIQQLERLMFLFLGGFSLVTWVANGHPPELFIICSLTLIYLLISIFYKGDRVSVRLLGGILAIGSAGVLHTFVVDSSNILIAWFYMLTVYYSFILSGIYRYLFIAVLIGTFTLTQVVESMSTQIEFIVRISLIITLASVMAAIRSIANRNIAERNQLFKDLRQTRDSFAEQLETRTNELQHEVQRHQQTEAKLASERQLLQTVIDTFPSRLFVKDRDSKFILANRASLKTLGYEDNPDDVIGKSDFDIFPHFAERTYANEQHLMATGEPLIDWEETTQDKDGVERHYLISKVPMYDSDTDKVVGLVGVTTEITSLKETQQALEISQNSLELFLSRLKSLNQITLRLTRLETLDELAYQSVREALEHLGFSRLTCWFIDPDNPTQLLSEYMVNAKGEIVSPKDKVIPIDKSASIKALIENKTFNTVLRDVPIHDRESNVIGHGDKAYTTLFSGGKVVGCLYADNLNDEQPFTNSHIEILNLYGATLGALFNRQRTQETLQSREQESILFQQQLKSLNQATLELQAYNDLDELCRQIVLLGRHHLGFERIGIWLAIPDQDNARRGMWGTTPDGELRDERGITLPIQELEAKVINDEEIIAIQDIDIYDSDVEGNQEFVRNGWILIGLMVDGEKQVGWLYADNAIEGKPLTQNHHELFRLYVANVGVLINRQRAEYALHTREEEAHRFQQQLKTLHEVTIELESAATLDDLCRRAVMFGRKQLGFERLGIWLTILGDPNKRRGMWGTDAAGNLRDERDIIAPVPEQETQLMQENEVLVLQKYDIYDHIPISEDEMTLDRDWLMIGMMSDGATRLGWLFADNALNKSVLTPNQQELFRLFAATLGVLINRHHAQDALLESENEALNFQQQLKKLNEITIELESAATLDELCRRAVIFGRDQLDFERLGIWLTIPDQPDKRRGMWGTDTKGNLRDDRGLIGSVPDREMLLMQEDEVIVLQDFDVYDQISTSEAETAIRRDWLMIGMMSDGATRLGWLFADNALNNSILTTNQQELFRLFAATLGVLINRHHAQTALLKSENEALNFQQQLKKLNEVTIELESAENLDELCRLAIMFGREQLDFERLGIWLTIPDQPGKRKGMWGTDSEGNLRDERDIIAPIPDYEMGIPIDNEVIVLHNVEVHDGTLEKTVLTNGWLMIGVMLDGATQLGWLYADNALRDSILTPNQQELFRLFAATLGVLINRHHAQTALLKSENEALNFQQQLKKLNEVTIELESAENLDELCRLAIIYGREKLDFQRIGIWLTVANEPDMRQGMWGTDESGHLRDERGQYVPISDDESKMVTENEVIAHQDVDVYDFNPITQEMVKLRRGWNLVGVMWDGTTRLGWLYADNTLAGGVLTPNQLELFRLYAATLGVLINRHHAQAALLESENEALNFQQQLKKLNEISLELQTIDTLNELCKQAIILGRGQLGFDRMGIWLPIPDEPEMFQGTWGTDPQGQLRDERHLQLPIPDGHNELWDINEIVITQNKASVMLDNELTNIGYVLNGLMQDEGEVLGWASVDNAIHNQPLTPNILELFRLYIATMGVLIARLRVQEALKASEEEAVLFQKALKSLSEVRLELEATTSLHELCKQAVILGRDQLGFDRIGIWLVTDDNPNMTQGTWGTDSQGNIRDESHLRLPIPNYQNDMQSEGEILILQDEVSCKIIEGESIKIDWALIGLMRDGSDRIGWISTDNHPNRAPLTQNKYELFRLYVATINLLCTRQKADDLLREREIRYRAMTEASSDIIVIINKDRVITYISPSISRLMGIDAENVVGSSISDVIHRDDIGEVQHILEECLQTAQLRARVNEFRTRHADGHWVKLEALMTSLIDDPIINGVLVSCRDMTQRLIVEEGKRIVQREQERALVLRQFIGDISHDFLTPLSTISTTAYLIKHGRQDDIDRRVTTIDQQIDRLHKLIDNLKTITKLDDMSDITMEKVDVNTILQSIPYYKNDLIAKKQLTLTLDLEEDLHTITGNIGLLRDAIFHIVNNAVNYTREADRVHVQSYQEDNDVVIEIIDSGVGISQQDLPFIFDRLYRADKSRNTNTGGSGLGLAIARRIIDLHHGTISIASELDEGTQVTIKLPHLTHMIVR